MDHWRRQRETTPFLIYLNDIRYASDNADLDLFADDSNAFVVSNNLNEVFDLANRVCSQMSIWFRSNLLSVNYDKTSFILFYPTKIDEYEINSKMLKITINGKPIDRVDCVRFLGVFIDDQLNF